MDYKIYKIKDGIVKTSIFLSDEEFKALQICVEKVRGNYTSPIKIAMIENLNRKLKELNEITALP
jgi:hypothetical protein